MADDARERGHTEAAARQGLERAQRRTSLVEGLEHALAALGEQLAGHRQADAAAGLDEADSTSIAELYERAASLRLQLTPTTLEVTS